MSRQETYITSFLKLNSTCVVYPVLGLGASNGDLILIIHNCKSCQNVPPLRSGWARNVDPDPDPDPEDLRRVRRCKRGDSEPLVPF